MSTAGNPVPGQQPAEGSLEDWLVVVTSAFGVYVSVIYIYSMGVFIGPLELEFGWSRAQTTGGLAVVSLVSVVMAPFVGMSIDKWGPRRIAMTGTVICCSAIAALGSSTGSIWHWWMLWSVIAIGDILIKPTVWMTAVTARFDTYRGIAIGVALSGAGIAAATLPSIGNALIWMGGWRFAYVVLGVACAVIVLPLLFLYFRDVPRPQAADGAPARNLPGLAIRDGLRTSRFYRMAIATLLLATGILGLMVHLVPIFISQGMTSQTAAGVAGAAGVSSFIGRILTGLLLDRVRATVVGAIVYGLPALACLVLVQADGSMPFGILCAAIVGFCVGAEADIVGYMVAKYFGRLNYGLFVGSIVGTISLGAGLGSTFIGAMYDYFGSYAPVLWAIAPVFLVCATLMGTLGPYPNFANPRQGTQSR